MEKMKICNYPKMNDRRVKPDEKLDLHDKHFTTVG